MKWTCEIVQVGGVYSATLTIDGEVVNGLPEQLPYQRLKRAIKQKTGIVIAEWQTLKFEPFNGAKRAIIGNVEQSPCPYPTPPIEQTDSKKQYRVEYRFVEVNSRGKDEYGHNDFMCMESVGGDTVNRLRSFPWVKVLTVQEVKVV